MQDAKCDVENEIEWRKHLLSEMTGLKSDVRELRTEVSEVKKSVSWMKIRAVTAVSAIVAYFKSKGGG